LWASLRIRLASLRAIRARRSTASTEPATDGCREIIKYAAGVASITRVNANAIQRRRGLCTRIQPPSANCARCDAKNFGLFAHVQVLVRKRITLFSRQLNSGPEDACGTICRMSGPPQIFPPLPVNMPSAPGSIAGPATVPGTGQSQFQPPQSLEVFAPSLGVPLVPPSPADPRFIPSNMTQAGLTRPVC